MYKQLWPLSLSTAQVHPHLGTYDRKYRLPYGWLGQLCGGGVLHASVGSTSERPEYLTYAEADRGEGCPAVKVVGMDWLLACSLLGLLCPQPAVRDADDEDGIAQLE